MEIPKHVIFDYLAGEAVAINLLSGAYYLLDSSGATVLKQVQDNQNVMDSQVASQLLQEGLLCGVIKSVSTSEIETKPPFEKFTDLESLLSADPVHDVDDFGWPKLQ